MRISKYLYPPSIARCQHVKVNGVQCGSPALKNRKLCHFHQRWQQGRMQLNANQARRSRYSLDLPILEDANSIQVALMQGMRLLLTNQVDHRTAALLFYALQTASSNLSRTTFEPRPQQVVIDPRSIPDTSLGDDAWYKEEFEPQETETDKDDETSDDIPATVNIQAMADCARVKPGLRPGRSGRVPTQSRSLRMTGMNGEPGLEGFFPPPAPHLSKTETTFSSGGEVRKRRKVDESAVN